MKIIDNFLPMEDFIHIKHTIMEHSFPFFVNNTVTNDSEPDEPWRWYGTHLAYDNDVPTSDCFEPLYNCFIPRFGEMKCGFKSLIRIKINLYPNTQELKENFKHVDCDFSHNAAVYSLNTCDGFTRLGDGTKIDSVENRIVIFEGGELHNSTTTTNKLRYNINFNWI
jgi:hypothetical protein